MNMSTAAGISSSITNWEEYDVFLSFRGDDTRRNFLSHLYTALSQNYIKVYKDDIDLEKGGEISHALPKAIEKSKLCIIVLSKNYASSTWCLEELVHILRCKGTDGQKVVPIFYNVDPSHVRKQEGSYATAFAKLENRFKSRDEKDKVQAWKEALMKVANISGWASLDHNYRNESELIGAIVEFVNNKLGYISVSSDDLKGLVGIDEGFKKFASLLDVGSLSKGHIVGIWGPGGIGKTTLARVVFNRFSNQFEACCFLDNVREKSKIPGHLENKIFSELFMKNKNLPTVNQFEITKLLRRKKVLIVLDDVDDTIQLEQLVGTWLGLVPIQFEQLVSDYFGFGSRIIVTSRDLQVLKNIGVDEPYEVEGLTCDEAFQLFSMYAFRKNSSPPDKIELSKTVINFAGGIPLALKVLGCRLYSKSTKVWESTLDKLQKVLDKDILCVLKISYDALDETEKDIFLDIACFFKGENIDFVTRILDGCYGHATAGISVLIDKCLITLGRYRDLCMHDLLQMMAFAIVSTKSTEEPRKGSRLWNVAEIDHALKYNRGNEVIEGISLDTTNFNEEIRLSPMTFSKMSELRLLKINGTKVSLSQGPLPFPDTLRYLSWPAYPLKSLSTNFTAKNLVELDLRGSKLEQLWDGIMHLENLKGINLSCSRHLTQIPDLSKAPNIEEINLNLCDRLTEVPSSFQHLDKLEQLELIGCSSLCTVSRLPNNLRSLLVFASTFCEKPGNNHIHICDGHLTKGATVLRFPSHFHPPIEICSNFKKFPEILKPMESLKALELDFTAIKELPLSIEHLIGLQFLSVKFCPNLEFLPNTIHKLTSLVMISLVHSHNVKSLPVLPPSLSALDANGCKSLETMSSILRISKHNWDDLYTNISNRFVLFSFIDCEKLDENGHKILMDDAQFRIFRFATLYSKYGSESGDEGAIDIDDPLQGRNFHYCWAGSEIPRWIIHKSEGSSISINFPPCVDQWYNRTYLGLAICVVFEKEDYADDFEILWNHLSYECLYTSPDGDSLSLEASFHEYNLYDDWSHNFCQECGKSWSESEVTEFDVNCEHVFLYYDRSFGEILYNKKGKYEACENGFTSAATATASFSFKLLGDNVKVKKCGVHLLYAQEAEKFGFVEPYDWEERQSRIMQRYKNNSFSETEEEEPLAKRITTTQNDQQLSLINNANPNNFPGHINSLINDSDTEKEEEENWNHFLRFFCCFPSS